MAGPGSALSSPALAGASGDGGRALDGDAQRLAARFIKRHGMLAPRAHVLAAFSGGADSTALALVLKALGYRVTLAHIDHGMRADSALDAFHCRSTARRLGLDIEVMRVKVEPRTEAGARRSRYDALEKMRVRAGADRIATGHTLNDEAETVRMRLERGGFGLGIPPVRGKIIRPLLCVGRRSTERACREAGVLFLEDPSNADTRFTRNRIRKQLALAPEADIDRLLSLGALNRSRKDALDAAVSAFSDLLSFHPEPRLDRRGLLAVPDDVARGLVRRALGAAGVEASERHVGDILRTVAPHPGAGMDLPGGIAVWSDSAAVQGEAPGSHLPGPRDWLIIGRRPHHKDIVLPEAHLEVPGVTVLPEWGLAVTVSMEPPPDASELRAARPGRGPGREEVFDAETLPSGLAMRQWRPGDRFQPLRREPAGKNHPLPATGGSKKLQDFFVDLKVPREDRHRVPLLAAGADIVWVAGHRIDNRYKVTPQTRRAARMRIAALEADL